LDRIPDMTDKEQSNAESTRDVILRRCERWLQHEVQATFQEENGYDLWEAVKAALAQSNAEPDEDRPLGFRTNDVPNPYAEGPQSDMESGGPADYIPIGGAGNGA
jgi:hypothetical protein